MFHRICSAAKRLHGSNIYVAVASSCADAMLILIMPNLLMRTDQLLIYKLNWLRNVCVGMHAIVRSELQQDVRNSWCTVMLKFCTDCTYSY